MYGTSIIPVELIRDVPLVTITGCTSLQIEHHHGMVSYTPEQIAFDTGCGLLTVSGAELFVSRYSSSDAELTGHICNISLESGDDA